MEGVMILTPSCLLPHDPPPLGHPPKLSGMLSTMAVASAWSTFLQTSTWLSSTPPLKFVQVSPVRLCLATL